MTQAGQRERHSCGIQDCCKDSLWFINKKVPSVQDGFLHTSIKQLMCCNVAPCFSRVMQHRLLRDSGGGDKSIVSRCYGITGASELCVCTVKLRQEGFSQCVCFQVFASGHPLPPVSFTELRSTKAWALHSRHLRILEAFRIRCLVCIQRITRCDWVPYNEQDHLRQQGGDHHPTPIYVG